jgi:hypothetical protein
LGEFSSYWANGNFGQFKKMPEVGSQNFWLFFTEKVLNYIIIRKNALGHILGNFYNSSSGHSGRNSVVAIQSWPNKQGDQIWRIFAQWVTVYYGQIFDN